MVHLWEIIPSKWKCLSLGSLEVVSDLILYIYSLLIDVTRINVKPPPARLRALPEAAHQLLKLEEVSLRAGWS